MNEEGCAVRLGEGSPQTKLRNWSHSRASQMGNCVPDADHTPTPPPRRLLPTADSGPVRVDGKDAPPRATAMQASSVEEIFRWLHETYPDNRFRLWSEGRQACYFANRERLYEPLPFCKPMWFEALPRLTGDMQVFVMVPGFHTLSLSVSRSHLVSDVLNHIGDITGRGRCLRWDLRYRGGFLQHERTFEDYDLPQGATLNLV